MVLSPMFPILSVIWLKSFSVFEIKAPNNLAKDNIHMYIYTYIINCLRFANPAEATGGLEAWRLGGWRFGASGILERRHRRCLEGTWERWEPAFVSLRFIQKYVVMSLCVCVCFVVRVVCVSAFSVAERPQFYRCG